MTPLIVCPDKPDERRRSKRPRRHDVRTDRVELRAETREREAWIRAAAAAGYLGLSDWIRDRCNASSGLRSLMSSVNEHWNTPAVVLETLAPLGPIGLDPCSNAGSIVNAAHAYMLPAHDGLALSWTGHGLVFVNPPYGDEIPPWIAKAVREAADGAEIALLVPARTETAWFDALAAVADVALWRGRLRFLGAPSCAPFPSALAYAGPRRELFAESVRRRCTGVLSAGVS